MNALNRVIDHSIRIPRSFPSRNWPKVGWPCPFPCSIAYAVVLGLVCLNVMQGSNPFFVLISLTQESAWYILYKRTSSINYNTRSYV